MAPEPKTLTTRQTLATVLVTLVVMAGLIALNILWDSRLSGIKSYWPQRPASTPPPAVSPR